MEIHDRQSANKDFQEENDRKLSVDTWTSQGTGISNLEIEKNTFLKILSLLVSTLLTIAYVIIIPIGLDLNYLSTFHFGGRNKFQTNKYVLLIYIGAFGLIKLIYVNSLLRGQDNYLKSILYHRAKYWAVLNDAFPLVSIVISLFLGYDRSILALTICNTIAIVMLLI